MPHIPTLENVLEKRQDLRVRCSSPVQVAMRTEEAPVVGELCDVSNTGLRMRVNRALRLGEDYPIYVGPAAGNDGMLISAHPVWVKAASNDREYEVGCRFTAGTRMPVWFRGLNALSHVQQRRTIRLSGTFDTILEQEETAFKIRAVTRDISFSGAGLHALIALPLGTRLEARIDFVSLGTLKAPVEVVYCKACAGDMAGYTVGVSFGPMKERQARRLAKVLAELKSAPRD